MAGPPPVSPTSSWRRVGGVPTRLRSIPLRQSERAIRRPKRNLPPVPVESLKSRAYAASRVGTIPVSAGSLRLASGVNLRHFLNTVQPNIARENATRRAAENVRRNEAARRIQRLWRASVPKTGLKGYYFPDGIFGQKKLWKFNTEMVRRMRMWTQALNRFERQTAGTTLGQWFSANQRIGQVRTNLRNYRPTANILYLVEIYPKKRGLSATDVFKGVGIPRNVWGPYIASSIIGKAYRRYRTSRVHP